MIDYEHGMGIPITSAPAEENAKSTAFPFVCQDKQSVTVALGLSKREVFAMAAMQGILSLRVDLNKGNIARDAVEMADCLLEALAK